MKIDTLGMAAEGVGAAVVPAAQALYDLVRATAARLAPR
jgi:hypothetical protein